MLSRNSLNRWTPVGTEELLHLLMQGLPDSVIFLLTVEGCVGSWNGSAERLLGFQEPEALAENFSLFLTAEDRQAGGLESDLRTAATEGSSSRERWLVRQDGTLFWALVKMIALWTQDGRLLGFAAVVRDLTEQRRLQQKQQESERRFRAIFDQTFECVMLLRPDGTLIEVNRPTLAFRSLQSGDLLGRPLWDTPWLGTAPALCQAVRTMVSEAAAGKLVRAELELTDDQGNQRIFDFSLKPVFAPAAQVALLIAEAREITERKRLEAQLHQKQKMEAIGQLAGGIAHDFNNLLVVINGYSEVLLHMLPAENPARVPIGEIYKAGERAATLTRQLLAFGRLQILAPRVLDLNAVVLDLEKMLRRIIGEDIDLATALEPGLRQVLADAGQMEQVVLNLVVNARDAMPRGGHITIATRNVKLDESYAQTHLEAKPGRYVLLSVSDNGCGMTEEVKKHIFEPFFTTKEVGKGTGLGLATVFGIVKQSGGVIEVYSEADQGTTFKIYLPVTTRSAEGRRPLSALGEPPRGTETILLVEDEPGVRAFGSQALRSWGYKVLEASDGTEAHNIAQQYPGMIHLLVSDVVMPKMGGHQLAEKLLLLRPELKVLFLSGFTDDAVVRHGILEANVNFLQKPFSLVVLAHKVREVLEKSGEELS